MLTISVFAHSGKPRTYAIIDTDCAPDDLRTICMLLGDRSMEILAITTTEGALTPAEGCQKVKGLLNEFYHQGIPVAAGREVKVTASKWRGTCQQVYWGEPIIDTIVDSMAMTAKDLMIKTINNEQKPVTLICLGALTNLSDVLTAQPQLKEKINRVVWYNSGAQPMTGLNFEVDPQSAIQVMDSGVPMMLVSPTRPSSAPVDRLFLAELGRNQSSCYAQKVADCHATPPLRDMVRNENLRIWDELTVVALNAPQLFNVDSVAPNIKWYSIDVPRKILPLERQILAIYQGPENVEGKVFYRFPLEESYYIRDVMPIIGRAVQRHGQSEFRAAVLANELHNHLDIYTTIGVKMGTRAREYFNTGADNMNVTTYAGNLSPMRCLNDGLLVSTGCMPGLGQIAADSVTADSIRPEVTRPEATFAYKDKKVTLRLKPEYQQQVQAELQHGVDTYGADTEANWQYVRNLALKYWLDWDRHQIFEVIPENEVMLTDNNLQPEIQ